MRPLTITCHDGSTVQVQDVPSDVKRWLAWQERKAREKANAGYRDYLILTGAIKPFRYAKDAPDFLYEAKWERDLDKAFLPIDPACKYYQESLKRDVQEGDTWQ